MTAMPDALELSDIVIDLAGRRLIGPLSLRVEAGEIVTLMGPSGCGKSSLLAYICGTLDPMFQAAGDVALGGKNIGRVAPEFRGIGILFQDDLLFPHMSVGGNLAFALPPGAGQRRQRTALIAEALAEAGLAGFADRDPATLSGGQRARIALLRALLSRPRALLLDEPFNKLDADLRMAFRASVFSHARSRGLPTLLVTHDPEDAAAAGGRTIDLRRSAPQET
jgi:putative thiamine transport system ATP-binding protein